MTDITEALTSVLNQPKNVTAFKKKIDKLGLDEEKYLWVVYQTIGNILKLENSSKDKLKPLLKQIKKHRVGWKDPMYDNVRQKLEEHDDYLVNPFEVSEGVVECKKCGSKKTYSCQRQCRGSDEPMTTFSKCVNCGNEWTYSG